MAFAVGSTLAAFGFAKNRKKYLAAGAVILVVGLIYAGMKWDAWRIENLKEDLQKERQANQQNQTTIEESGRVQDIDEALLTRLLDERDAMRSDTDDSIKKVVEDVRRIQQEEREDLERQLRDLTEQLDQNNDAPAQPRPVKPTPIQPQLQGVSPRVAERLADGMWDTYCRGVPDDRVCPQRQPDSDDPG